MPEEIILCIDVPSSEWDGVIDNTTSKWIREDIYGFGQRMAEHVIPTWEVNNDFSYIFEDCTEAPENDYQKSMRNDLILCPEMPEEIWKACVQVFTRRGYELGPDPTKNPVIFKIDSSAFSNKNFCPYLRKHGVKKIYITGVHAAECVAATALDASRNGFEVIVVSDLVFGAASMEEQISKRERKRRNKYLMMNYLIRAKRIALPVVKDREFDHRLSETINKLNNKAAEAWHVRSPKGWGDWAASAEKSKLEEFKIVDEVEEIRRSYRRDCKRLNDLSDRLETANYIYGHRSDDLDVDTFKRIKFVDSAEILRRKPKIPTAKKLAKPSAVAKL